MTTTEVRTPARGTAPEGAGAQRSAPPAASIRRGAVLVVGAIVLIVAVKPYGTLPYFWVPSITGVSFLLAAAVAGRRSPLWGPGMVVTGWGVGQLVSGYFTFGIHTGHPMGMGGMMGSSASAGSSAMVDGLMGLGAVLLGFMISRGFAASVTSVGLAIVFIAAGEFIHGTWGSAITPVFCGLTAIWGLTEMAKGLPAFRRGSPASV